MAREVQLNGHRYWILSEPEGEGWRAWVVELLDGGAREDVGISATAETRTAADARAEQKLRRLLQARSD